MGVGRWFSILLVAALVLGGCSAPVPSPSPETPASPTAIASLTATAVPVVSASLATIEPTATRAAEAAPTASPTLPPSATPNSTVSPTLSPAPTATALPPTATAATSPIRTATHAPSPSPVATGSPTRPAVTPSPVGSAAPSVVPKPSLTSTPPATVPTIVGLVDVGLDPGHHRLDVGAVGGGLREYELTLEIAGRTRSLLEARGITVRLSRSNNEPVSAWNAAGETALIQQEQTARINAVMPARIFVSIHLNAFGDASVAGTETYYNGSNQGSESLALARALQASVRGSLGRAGYNSPDRGVKEDLAAGKPYGHFFSLRGGLPSALVESLFLSNPTEATLLGQASTRQAIAAGLADGIAKHLGR
jgi:N-acetylmuramoyl-L-alanine amidase